MQTGKFIAPVLILILLSFSRSLHAGSSDESGRNWFVLSTSAKSVCLLPNTLHFTNHYTSKEKLGLSLLAAGSSFYASYLLTDNVDLGYGRVAMMNYGGTLGLLYPMQLKLFLHYGTTIDQKKKNRSDGTGYNRSSMFSEKIQSWATFLAFPYGIYAGFSSERVGKNELGDALVATYFSQTLGAMGYLIPFFFYDPSVPSQKNDYFALASLLTMGLIPTGFTTGTSIVNDSPIETGRGIMLYITGFLGSLSGYTLPLLFESESHFSPINFRRFQITTTVLGYALGSSMAFQMQKGLKLSTSQSILIGSSTLAGLLIGTSIPLLKESDDKNLFARTCLSGAWVGFLMGNMIAQSHSGLLTKVLSGRRSTATFHISVPALMNISAIAASKRFGFSKEIKVDLAQLRCNF